MGVSINITKIISIKRLPRRAIEALVLLLAILVVALLFLVPGQSTREFGFEVLLVGAVAWYINTSIDVRNYGETEQQYRSSYFFMAVFDQVSLVLYLISGILILVIGESGVYWLVPSTILSFLKSMTDAWVLLVEINR